MELTTREVGEVTLVELSGDLDGRNTAKLTEAASRLIARGRTRLVLSFQQAGRVDSNGVRALLLVLKRMRAAGGGLVLCELPKQVASAFEFAGLSKSFAVTPTREQAMREVELEAQREQTGSRVVEVAVDDSGVATAEVVELSEAERQALELFHQMEAPAFDSDEG
ncbi:MAG: anti-sigma factor antagonist [Acidobacteria bacterium]|mgnify:CR=1 FL=1|nr:MAG: anti-sigma factor antagonist [Acidobacteriota bacterium]REK03205.1 MAG: anti-sigma factor antagonist [Acidobacteriota bacterium]